MSDPATPATAPPEAASDALAELPLRSIADALENGVPIDLVADVAGTTPIGLVVGGVQWLAEHADEVTNDEHLRICTVLATALGPVPPPPAP